MELLLCVTDRFFHIINTCLFFFFPIIKNPFFQETSLVLCDDLEGWHGMREGRGYMYNYS